jgi:hypothetical protein
VFGEVPRSVAGVRKHVPAVPPWQVTDLHSMSMQLKNRTPSIFKNELVAINKGLIGIDFLGVSALTSLFFKPY